MANGGERHQEEKRVESGEEIQPQGPPIFLLVEVMLIGHASPLLLPHIADRNTTKDHDEDESDKEPVSG
jgi:hypothetical protein